MRDITKIVDIGEDQYKIKKFTAIDGLQIARLVISKLAPLIPLIASDGISDGLDGISEVLGGALDSLDDKDIETLVKKCLRYCSKMLKGGTIPCIDVHGNYGVEDLEYDLITTIQLVIEAIKWGAGDFFDGKASGLLQKFNLGSTVPKE